MPERARRKLGASSNELLSAKLAQKLIENLGVSLVIGGGTFWDSFAIAAFERLERRVAEIRIVLAHERLQSVPFLVRCRQKFVCLGRCAEKPLDRIKIVLGPALAEYIADHGHLALGAELAHHVLDADQLAKAAGFEPRGIRPEGEDGVDLALLRPLVEQRRRAVFLLGLGPQIEIGGPERVGHE